MQGITWFPIHDLTLWDDNPNEGDVGAIINSIKQFGYNDVIAVYHGMIMGGNHRLKAVLQLLNSDYVLSERDTQLRLVNGNHEISAIDVSHLETQTEANAFALALNRTARLGYDDPYQLTKLLKEIAASSEKLLISTGFDADDIEELLRGIPDFQPVDGFEQPRLDEFDPIICPHCGKNTRDKPES